MTRLFVGALAVGAALAPLAHSQVNEASPPPAATAPVAPAPPPLSPGVGPLTPPGAGSPPVPGLPGVPPGVGARPMPPMPGANDAIDPTTAAPRTPQPAAAPPGSARLIAFLESLTPYVQGFDFLLMLFCGIYCLRSRSRRKNTGITLLAISCFAAAVILLGFFLFGILHGRSAVAQSAYIVARLLAPFELLLFALGIIYVARANR